MSHEELTTIVTRLDRLEQKVDELLIRYERHEAEAETAERTVADFRRFLYSVAAGVVVVVLTGLGGFLLAMARVVNGG
jgi:hypothetical protein